jgi:signal transduction histidine kinase
VTLAFAGAMAVVLAIIGGAVYLRYEADLDATINQGLRAGASDISALVQRSPSGLAAPGRSVLVERGESFAQILDAAGGTVVDASPRLRRASLLDPGLLARAARGTVIVTHPNPFERAEDARLLATPVDARGRRLVVVVGAAVDDRDSQLRTLALLLAIGGPLALLLASLAGYGVASAALRPVEAMRRKAEQISDERDGERLPVGRADDEISRLGTTLNGMLERVQRGVRRERAFVADASHELRTPLAILRTELELALQPARTPDELRDALRSAAEETERLAELAEALLVIARADGGRLPLVAGDADVAELLQRTRDRWHSRASARGREVVVGDAPHAHVIADARRLEQALDNLVDNALKHGDGAIRLTATVNGQAVALHVSDDGAGFAPDFIGQAFERFARADHARARGGSGLGLAIVQLIARAHGGEARAANRPDGGARVWIELPSGAPAAVDEPSAAHEPAAESAAGDESSAEQAAVDER